MQNKINEITQEEVAEGLLFGLWQNIDSDYKKRYVKNIWEQFENAVKAATYTDRLTKFIEIFKSRLPCELQGINTKDIFIFLKDCKEDYKVLTWLREETTYLVMICRMLNQEKKEAFKQKDIDLLKILDKEDASIIQLVSNKTKRTISKCIDIWQNYSDSIGSGWVAVDEKLLIKFINN